MLLAIHCPNWPKQARYGIEAASRDQLSSPICQLALIDQAASMVPEIAGGAVPIVVEALVSGESGEERSGLHDGIVQAFELLTDLVTVKASPICDIEVEK